MIAEIIAVGSEMLTPHRQDTNSLHLTAGLNTVGVAVAFKTIVGDNRAHLISAIRIALSRADIVLLSGGLGPTEDDLTRECAAQALHLELHTDPDAILALVQRFAARGLPMPPNNHRQAEVLDGARLLPNPNGSAPGQWLDTTYPNTTYPNTTYPNTTYPNTTYPATTYPNTTYPATYPTTLSSRPESALSADGAERPAVGTTSTASTEPHRKILILLPGPPKELQPMFDEQCLPRLRASLPPRALARRTLRMALLPESTVDARTAPLYRQFPDIETTILTAAAEIQLHFLCAKPTLAAAQARIDALTELTEREMGDDIFSSRGESLEEIVLMLLGLNNLTLAVAESCTGGLLASRLTAIPNASRSFAGGAIAYTAATKSSLCDVPTALIERHGAVSEPIARALAEGIRTRTGASLGLSITGIAGPAIATGPDAAKPIGLVYLGLADADDTQVKRLHLSGDRDRIRLWATQHALEMLRRRFQ